MSVNDLDEDSDPLMYNGGGNIIGDLIFAGTYFRADLFM